MRSPSVCNACDPRGSGRCAGCYGSGVNTALNSDIPECKQCGGSGRCGICGGSGRVEPPSPFDLIGSWLRPGSDSIDLPPRVLLDPEALLDIEATYLEALAAFWAVFWPSVVFAVSVFYAVMSPQVPYAAFAALRGVLGDEGARLMSLDGLIGVGLFAFWPQFIGWMGRWAGRRFKIDIIEGRAGGSTHPKLTFLLRLRVWFFIYWRLEVALFAACALATIMNVILLMFAVPSNAAVAEAVAAIGVIFLGGPLIIKLLVGHEFGNCRVTVQRAP